jgi:hypothetical protein
VFVQKHFFAKHLTMKQPRRGDKVDESDPGWKYQQLAHYGDPERHIYRIAAPIERAGRYQFVGLVYVNTNTKASTKGN